jgi:hypothetical protein
MTDSTSSVTATGRGPLTRVKYTADRIEGKRSVQDTKTPKLTLAKPNQREQDKERTANVHFEAFKTRKL